ncbi:VOC family protein [Shinella sp. CPCC 101442]|uniref:VOC family protein n=1 Tax=Shinella sp. CPCC 101442 TaxID=2932265 RepID=UPI002152FE41|nr:VOC family protein [Shinella sp. CPCC 101442]MCR6499712.1 VOC family protein [Shinella sp. CPCC 101442]
MSLNKIYAHLNCADLDTSIRWFTAIFNRGPDARPMEGLAEWHRADSAGFQFFQNPADAGHGTLTLILRALENERSRLETAGLSPGDIEQASYVRLIRLRDPDKNLVVLAEEN